MTLALIFAPREASERCVGGLLIAGLKGRRRRLATGYYLYGVRREATRRAPQQVLCWTSNQ